MTVKAKATKAKSTHLELTSIGVDIGKDVFHIVGFDRDGKIALRRKFKRLALTKEFEKLPRCIVGMEACLSAHFVSPATAGARLQTSDNSGDVREAVPKGTEERLQ